MLSLDRMEFATRSQLQALHNLSSKRNASRVLHNMKEYLNVKRLDENIYSLNAIGRKVIGSKKKPPQFNHLIYHTLLRNDAYIYFNAPTYWEVEKGFDVEIVEKQNGISLKKMKYVRPDVIFKVDGQFHFLEVDHKSRMQANYDKIRLYNQIIPSFTQSFHRPKLVFITTESRKSKLFKLGKEHGMDIMVLTKSEIY
ncbi:replication-relaxation family protein [Sutcliffiella horikoshii]|uniref:replication-relaxation family protein n=1 Tax=Sutcliffiella horikoshii TaxID=79883 RepID=UPI0020425BC7|nr:replication-relaxation family protein [Sutcliffiella horikoshii]MCM3616658.1 replication-relaxation family protein [Sutcliffiella horikoshii]